LIPLAKHLAEKKVRHEEDRTCSPVGIRRIVYIDTELEDKADYWRNE